MAVLYPGQLNRALTCAELDNNFAEFLNRANHTGTQLASTISDLEDTVKTFNTIIDLKSCCIDLTNRIEIIEATVDINTILLQFQNQYDEFVSNINTALGNSALIDGISNDIISIQGNISNLFTTTSGLQNQIDLINGEINTLQAELGAINTGSTTLTSRITTAEQDITNLETLTGGSLTSIANILTDGILTKTGANTVTTRSITVDTDDLIVTNTDGVSGNVQLELANTGVTPGTYNQATISVDTKGRVVDIATGSSLNEIAIIYSDATGTFTKTTWVTYPLDRVVQTSGFLTLNTTTSTFTLASGTYLLSMYAAPSIVNNGSYSYRIYNTTDNAVLNDIGGFSLTSPTINITTFNITAFNSKSDFTISGNLEYLINSDSTKSYRLEINANSFDTVSFGGSRSAQITLRKISL